ncbi:MAG: hypothetical protein B7Z44_02705 [Caulobacter sp. 12-67-6]|nr:MAG: hypothetical protein B7Z44_02705 [Caulobacter sp. 12-67-6]OYX73606.1 MAG: hypothetical protein B7Y81_02520 [Caulobacter sp. 32-67-35]
MLKSKERWLAYVQEADLAKAAFAAGRLAEAFGRLERAHILGQPWAGAHTWTHWMMLRIGWKRRDGREVRGQILRLAAGGLLSLFGWLPVGNTGAAEVAPKKPMALPSDLARFCDDQTG